MNGTCALVITTMNEIDGLRSIWSEIPFSLFNRVIVVDGHSTDGTLEWLKHKPCQVCLQASPGRGNAIREALADVTEDAVMVISSDGNDDPAYIPALLQAFRHGYDLVTGSRFMLGGATDDSDDPLRIRKLGNRFFTFLVNLLWNAGITDSAYDFRIFNLDAWKRMRINSSKNETEYMMSIRAAKLGLKVAHIPMVEGKRVGGQVKARTLQVGFSYLKLLLSELLN